MGAENPFAELPAPGDIVREQTRIRARSSRRRRGLVLGVAAGAFACALPVWLCVAEWERVGQALHALLWAYLVGGCILLAVTIKLRDFIGAGVIDTWREVGMVFLIGALLPGVPLTLLTLLSTSSHDGRPLVAGSFLLGAVIGGALGWRRAKRRPRDTSDTKSIVHRDG